MRRLVTVIAVGILGAAALSVTAQSAASAGTGGRHRFPDSIALPAGWQPEGFTIGRGTSFYVGSLANGAVFRGDLATGTGRVLVPGTAGTAKTGLKVDRHNRLWAAGAGGGDATVYDAATGATLAHYSARPFLYVVPLAPGGRLPGQSAVRSLALTGPAAADGAFNNGIVATPDGRLIVVQMVAGRLVSVDPATGASTVVDLHGYSVVNGDGLVLRGHLLYVVRNVDNKVAVLRLDRRFASGVPVRELTSPLLRVPSTADLFGPWLYLVNARFDVTPTPTTDYNVVRVRA